MRRLVSCLAALATSALAGCGSDGTTPAANGRHAGYAEFTAGGVHVTVTLGTGNHPTLVARFRPVKKGFHLYSADLPVGGVNGLGQRTKLDPVSAIRPAGPLRIDAPVHDLLIKPLHLTLPVYPDGPITARMAVRRVTSARPRVSVSYAACSDSVCYPPVKNAIVGLG